MKIRKEPVSRRLANRSQRLMVAAAIAVTMGGVTGCGTGMPPSPMSGVHLTGQAPANGSAIVMPAGNLILPGTGVLSFDLELTSPRESPWAQLNVYLLTSQPSSSLGYCGQNLPDAPTWGPFPALNTVRVKISGFQVYQVPCDVTGIRAMLHLRNNGNLTPPTVAETLVEGTIPVSYRIQR
jgi:hypothetical protein